MRIWEIFENHLDEPRPTELSVGFSLDPGEPKVTRASMAQKWSLPWPTGAGTYRTLNTEKLSPSILSWASGLWSLAATPIKWIEWVKEEYSDNTDFLLRTQQESRSGTKIRTEPSSVLLILGAWTGGWHLLVQSVSICWVRRNQNNYSWTQRKPRLKNVAIPCPLGPVTTVVKISST